MVNITDGVDQEIGLVSFSKMTTFFKCPHQYWLKYVLRAEVSTTENMDLGSVAHVAFSAYMVKGANSWHQQVLDWCEKQVPNYQTLIRQLEQSPRIADFQEIADTMANPSDVGLEPDQIKALYLHGLLKRVFPMMEHFAQWYSDYELVYIQKDDDIVPLSEYMLSYQGIVGVVDAVVRHRQSGAIFVVDFKTTENVPAENSDDYDYNVQTALYQYMLLAMGYTVRQSLLVYINSKPPVLPSVNKDGKSVSRVKVNSTWDLYKSVVLSIGADPSDYADMQAYFESKRFYKEHLYQRSAEEMESVWNNAQRSKDLIQMMHNHYAVMGESTPRAISSFNCNFCPFRHRCHSTLYGRDFMDISLFPIGDDQQ